MSKLAETILSYLNKHDSLGCVYKNIKNNEVFLVLHKQSKDAGVNMNEFVKYMSTQLNRYFAVTNVKKLTKAPNTGGSFQLPSKRKIKYDFVSNKIRFNSKDDSKSFFWIANAKSSDGKLDLILLKAKIVAIDNIQDTDESKSDQGRNRRPKFRVNQTFSQHANWTFQQQQFAKQCEHSFNLLATNSLQFHNNFWQGVLVNATDENINHFSRIYTSESIQVLRIKKNEMCGNKPFKIDQTYESIWNMIDHTKNENNIKISTLQVQQIKLLTLRCFKMDDPEKVITKPTAPDTIGRHTKKRKAIGSFANKCPSRMNIKVIQFLNKGVKVGHTVAMIEDSFGQHNHDADWGLRNKEKLHPLVVKRGRELFDKINVGRSQFVRFMLSYCQNDLRKDVAMLPENKAIGWMPDKNDPVFWPNKKRMQSLYRRLYQESYGKQTLKDQVRLQELIEKIKESDDIWQENDFLHFQQYVPDKHDDATGETEKGQDFIFIYQNKFQRDMFVKYGTDVTGIDCTYNTTKYGLKLYWLVVIDNLRHIQPAGFFITQYETDQTLEDYFYWSTREG